ncbi:MAG: tRNA (N(6)-L-threonylcarbamoyladenosine(37)-C(2))-methylthiotransferase MtaB [Cytophagaceae bacterium]|jgi:threonylcarbamoyladenosine tRNA methylthiotransferase MtaB|nr:tRNA (N(6)-L-threonylcarbamoyladenosine(37)-C(2))-methylthiotransferase MtaB [Cytophagaceae bacterium]
MSKKVAFYTLGCKLNFSETSTIGRMFLEQGFEKVEFHEPADVYIINTCSVTDHADKKCKKVVREALKHSPSAFIGIIGCYAQLKPEEIAAIPGVDAVLGAAEKFKLFELIERFEKTTAHRATIYNSPIEAATDYYCSYSVNDRTRTFLKVQDGCDYSCSFCTIPLARGNSRSDSIDRVVQTAKEIAAQEVKEIVLTGVNIGDFGIQNGERKERFVDLIQALDTVEGIDRFRISSIEPNLLSDEIIAFVAQSKKFVPHFHIPLQSGNNKQLKAMRRRYVRELYAERVQTIRNYMPHACIGVDVIVGFPGETAEDFMETYSFLNELDVSYFHVFTYSERENTLAAEWKERVPNAVRSERNTMLRTLSEKKRHYFYQQHLNSTRKVLWEADQENGLMFGFTDNYIKVSAPYDPLWVNELKPVVLKQIASNGCVDIIPVLDVVPTITL